MVCRNFILPEPASYVFFYAVFNLRNLLYLILEPEKLVEILPLLCDPDLEKLRRFLREQVTD